MAAPMVKRQKTHSSENDEFRKIVLYILPTKIQKKRLETIKNCALSLKFTVLDEFR